MSDLTDLFVGPGPDDYGRRRSAKQVIVMRADLKMGRGKIAAQAGHASMKGLLARFVARQGPDDLDAAEREWYLGNFRKICLQIDSEAALLDLHQRALALGRRSHLIIDNGLTEFHNVPTPTCIAIGPHFDESFIGLTDHLKLY